MWPRCWTHGPKGKPTGPADPRRSAASSNAPSLPSLLRRALAARARPKAAEMASHEINKLGDKSATDEERATRKRRLISGPKSFAACGGNECCKRTLIRGSTNFAISAPICPSRKADHRAELTEAVSGSWSACASAGGYRPINEFFIHGTASSSSIVRMTCLCSMPSHWIQRDQPIAACSPHQIRNICGAFLGRADSMKRSSRRSSNSGCVFVSPS